MTTIFGEVLYTMHQVVSFLVRLSSKLYVELRNQSKKEIITLTGQSTIWVLQPLFHCSVLCASQKSKMLENWFNAPHRYFKKKLTAKNPFSGSRRQFVRRAVQILEWLGKRSDKIRLSYCFTSSSDQDS